MNDDCGGNTPIREKRKRKPPTRLQQVASNLKSKEYRQKFPEKVRAANQRWREKNREKYREMDRAWRRANPERAKAKYEKWMQTKGSQYFIEKRKNDPWFRIKQSLSIRTRMAIQECGSRKNIATAELLGAPIATVRAHIQSQFKRGTTWKNWGIRGWHLDHIVPCTAFDLTKEEEQRKCFHYTNLRPLWAADNIRKSDTIITCQPELPLVLSTN